MKKESIFFTITIGFVISLFLVIASFIVLVLHTQDEKDKHLSRKYLPVAKMVLEQQRKNGLTKYFVESLANMDMEFINDVGQMRAILYNPKTDIILERRFRSILVRVLNVNDESFLFIKNDRFEIMFKDTDYKHVSPLIYLIVVFGVLFIAVVLSFITTWKKLYPIKLLKDNVKNLGDENFDFDYKDINNAQDEVSLLAIEFKNTAKKLKDIKESRNVFIRNIMHELKTPITKGKFLSELENSEENSEKMKRVFTRLESLINEFTSIEELISSTKNVEKNYYFLGDVLDNAIDILMLDDDIINMEYENKKLFINFKLFSVAVKNLIDNAIKYSNDKKVTIKTENENIVFENVGEKLEHPLENYFEPFFANQSKSKNGFGLGLYIVNSILKANSCKLNYEYKDGINRFIIVKI